MTWLLAFVRASAEWSAVSAQANLRQQVKRSGRSQNPNSPRQCWIEWSAISAQANFGIAKVKPQSGGRSQNHVSQRLGEAFRSQNQHSQGVPA